MGVLGLFSVSSTLTLLVILTYRFFTSSGRANITRNQNILLIYSLLIADFQQSLAFVISFYWESRNEIVAPHPACFIQGWLLQIGDVSSGFFIMAIALHTFNTLVNRKQFQHGEFVSIIVGIWIFAIVLTVISPAKFGYEAFVRAGAWCSIPVNRPSYRLGLHYFWVFLAEFGTVLIYIPTFVVLHRRLKTLSPLSNSSRIGNDDNASSASVSRPCSDQQAVHGRKTRRINRAARYMILYPVVYICLTLPLAGGRMAQMAAGSKGQVLPDWYWITAGALIASSGWMDVIVYSLTRHVFPATSRQGTGRNGAPTMNPLGGDGAGVDDIGFTENGTGLKVVKVQVASRGQTGLPFEVIKEPWKSSDNGLTLLRNWRPHSETGAIVVGRSSPPWSTDHMIYGNGMRGIKAGTTFEDQSETIELESPTSSSSSINRYTS